MVSQRYLLIKKIRVTYLTSDKLTML